MYSFYRLPPAGAALSHPTRCSEWFAGHFNLFCFLSMFFLFGLKPWAFISSAFDPLLYTTPDPTRGWEQATPGTADASIKHLTTASLHDFLVLISLALKIHLLELRFLIWSNKFKSWQTLYETKVTLFVATSYKLILSLLPPPIILSLLPPPKPRFSTTQHPQQRLPWLELFSPAFMCAPPPKLSACAQLGSHLCPQRGKSPVISACSASRDTALLLL